MKGNKLAIAVILALIVCLVLIPTCAFAEEGVDDAPVVEQGEQIGGQPEKQPSEPKEEPAEPENPTQPEEPGEQEPEQPVPDDPAEPSEEEESGDVPSEGENDSAANPTASSDGMGNVSFTENGEYGTAVAPPAVSANDGTGYDSISEALKHVDEITLNSDITEDVVIDAGRTITINLNGKTLTNNTSGVAAITNNGTLTINGSSDPALDNGTVIGNNASAIRANEGAKTILNKGTYTSVGDNLSTIFNCAGAEMIIGDVEKITGSSDAPAIRNYGTLTVSSHNGGVFTNSGAGAVIYNVGRATINAGTFTTESDDYNNALIVNEGSLDITGGTFRSRNKPVLLNIGFTDIYAEGSEFTNESGALIANGYDSSSKQPNSGWITISNGTFKAGKDGKGILFGQAGSESGGQVTMFYGNFNGKIIKMNYTIGGSGIFNDSSIMDFISENEPLIEVNGMFYAGFGAYSFVGVNENIVNAARLAQPITVHSINKEFNSYTDIPAGTVIVNVCGQSFFINGVEVKNGETYTVPVPAAAPAAVEPAQPAAKADDKLVEAKSDSSDNQATVTIEGTTAKITVSDSNGDAVAPQEVTIKSVSALEESGVTEASIQLDTNLVIDLDIAVVKNAGASEVVTVLNENNVVTIKSGDKELVSVDVKPLLEDAGQQVTVKYSENSLKVVYGGEVVFDVDLSDLEVSGEKLTVKLENGMLKIYDSNGNLLKKIEKA